MTTPSTRICRHKDCQDLRISGSLYCRRHRDQLLHASGKKAAKKLAKKSARKAARKVARRAKR
ncbi:MAG TPA: hypothetical protein PKV98_01655 [Burkholderiaceae bacterium]|nr:hypothetical protein [Burkholderiaceae bacterium]